MKANLVTALFIASFSVGALAQDKAITFSNITEATVGFQVGKTTQVTQIGNNETELDIAGYQIPSPRVSSSFGAFFGKRFFIGPGFSYMYQAKDDNNPIQHHVGVYGHARLQILKGFLRPYLGLKGGYTHIIPQGNPGVFDQTAYTWDGVFAEPEVGLGIKLGGHAQLNASLGYQFLNVWNRSEGLSSVSAFGPELEDVYHRLVLSVGFSFF